MNLLAAAAYFLLALLIAAAGATRLGAWLIERRNPPAGGFLFLEGTKLHFLHVPAPAPAELPAIVFLHGASSNLRDQMVPLRPLLEGQAELLFLDRPGLGWSERGSGNETPFGQAKTLAALMDRLGIERAILVGHSIGAATATAFALDYPDRTAGLVLVSPATHPWPGGATAWYYSLTAVPVIGQIFAETFAWPTGTLRLGQASDCVFSPNKAPEGYTGLASIGLVLRPSAFRANALDVVHLYRHTLETAPRYPEIAARTIVISGDRDTVVDEEIHSIGLARDVRDAELVWVRNLGHKPDWIAPDLVVAAIEKAAGLDRDLQALARRVEARVAADRYGEGICTKAKASPLGTQPLTE
jgi:pimeloyl-ACP methyl ester carboxylesterase